MKRDKIKDQQFRDQIDAIVHDQNLSDTQKRVAAGKLLRETAARLKADGKTNAEISELTSIRVSRIRELTSGTLRRDDIALIIKSRDLSESAEFKIDGPWGHRGLEGLKAPVYIFVPGGEKKEVGEATVTIRGGMKFEIELREDVEDVDQVAFEVPMRFVVRKKQ